MEIIEISKEELANNWSFKELPDQTIRLNKYTAEGEVPSLVIPSLAGGKKVTEIGDEALRRSKYKNKNIKQVKSGAWGIKQIVFPVYLVRVGKAAFSGCNELESITFHEGLREIMEEAFWSCPNIKSVTLPKSLRHIGEHCFEYGAKITVYAPKDSYAEKYANEFSDLTFEEIDLKIDTPNIEIKTKKTPSKKLSAKNCVLLLEQAVIEGTPEELRQVIAQHAPFEFTARALGFAMRYGGEEKVRILAEAGVSFEYDKEDKKLKSKYHTAARQWYSWKPVQYELFPVFDKLFAYPQFFGAIYGRYEGLERLSPDYYACKRYPNYYDSTAEDIYHGEERAALPEEECAAAIDAYFSYENEKRRQKKWGGKSNMLFYALCFGFFKIADTLIKNDHRLGEVLFGDSNIGDIYFFLESYKKGYDLRLFEHTLRTAGIKATMNYRIFIKHFAISKYWNAEYIDLLTMLLCYNNVKAVKNITKAQEAQKQENSEDDNTLLISCNKANEFIQFAIEGDSDAAAVKICEMGLIDEKNINKYIELASSQKTMHALAVFMEWKNKNVDLAQEQRKAEERLKRRMNRKINPNSFGEMQKIWDMMLLNNKITITRYKGCETEITIPAQIGTRKVTAIGSGFQLRKFITKVIVQNGIEEINRNAFKNCTHVSEIELPQSIAHIGNGCFDNCPKLTICAPSGSEAEKYAKEHKIPLKI